METNALERILEESISKFNALLIESERRIDRTNEMVMYLAKTVNKLTETYSYHLKLLVESRDRTGKLCVDMSKTIEASREENKNLLKEIVDIAKTPKIQMKQ